MVVLSLWRENVCAGSFRLAIDEVPDLIEMLRAGLVRSYEDARDRLMAAAPSPPEPRPPPVTRVTRSGHRVRAGSQSPNPALHAERAAPRVSTKSARHPDTVRRGPDPEPVRPRRRPAPARAGRPRPRAAAVRGDPRAGGRRPARAQHGALRPARRRQDGAAQRAARPGRTARLGHRQDRGPSRPVAPDPARPGGARRGPRGRPPAPRPRPGRRGGRRAQGFALRTELEDRKGPAAGRWQPPIDVTAAKGRADSGDLELDLIELFTDVAALAGDLGVGIALFVDEMQDIADPELAALCGACHEISQQGAPLIVVGAGLPHLPVALAASKSYAERLFRYVVGRPAPPRDGRPRLDGCPAAERGRRRTSDDALDELYRLTDGYPYFVQAYGKVTWDVAVELADPRRPTCTQAAPEAEAELAVGFFGARYDRATPAERDYMIAMADLGDGHRRPSRSATADVAKLPRPQAAVALPGPRRADQEGPRLLRRARQRRVHRPALRQVPGAVRPMSATLVAKDLAGGHGHRTLFEGLDLTVAPGDVVGVVGANGAGKTTLLRILAGDLEPLGGTVLDRAVRRVRRLAAAGARAGPRRDGRGVRRPPYRRDRRHRRDGGGRRGARLRPARAPTTRTPSPSTAGWRAAPPTSTSGSRRCWPTSASTSAPDALMTSPLRRPGGPGGARRAAAEPLRRRAARRAHQRPRPGRARAARGLRPRAARRRRAGLPRPRVPGPLRDPDRRARPRPAPGRGLRRRLRRLPRGARGGPAARARGVRRVRRQEGRPGRRGPGPSASGARRASATR